MPNTCCFLNYLQPPPSFLGTMEEYVREAPRTAPLPNETIVSLTHFIFLRVIQLI